MCTCTAQPSGRFSTLNLATHEDDSVEAMHIFSTRGWIREFVMNVQHVTPWINTFSMPIEMP